jgi:hypothetical protein
MVSGVAMSILAEITTCEGADCPAMTKEVILPVQPCLQKDFRFHQTAYPSPSPPAEGVQLFVNRPRLSRDFNSLLFTRCPSGP